MATEHYREEMYRWEGNDTKYIKSGTYLEPV